MTRGLGDDEEASLDSPGGRVVVGGSERVLCRSCGRRAHPTGGDHLATVERAIVREQHAEPDG
jgi:hypothetical protein